MEAPLHTAAEMGKLPILNKQNQTLYIVDLVENTEMQFPEARDPGKKKNDESKFQPRHPDRNKNMVEASQDAYAFDYIDMTSYVGLSFTTYLNYGQLQKIRRDPRVERVTEVTVVEPSQAAPPWSDSPTTPPGTPNPAPANYFGGGAASEISSWGRVAINGKNSTASTKTRVYVLDEGVGNHADLNVVQRANPSCSTNGTNCIGLPSIGCYPHATHVAGIIGAKNSGVGTRGINAGAPIYSVALGTEQDTFYVCARYTTLASILSGLDWIKSDVVANGGAGVAVANMSYNGFETSSSSPTFVSKVGALNTPIYTSNGFKYPKIFFVQSAGNNNVDACSYAYSPSSTPNQHSASDGIMVVGSHDESGNRSFPFTNVPIAGNLSGSNYGSCVDIYAPGSNIWSASIGGDWINTKQRGDGTIYNSYGRVGGTSMAAPRIAGVAAWLAETYPPSSASALETLVRSYIVSGSNPPRVRLP